MKGLKSLLGSPQCRAAGPFQGLYQRKRLENILITQHSGSFHVAAPAWASLFFLLSLICLRHPSLGAGRHSLHQAWVNISQVNAWICIPPIVSHHIQAHVHTHTHKPVHNYTQRRDRLKPALVLTTKISFSRMQTRQTSCHIWVTRLSVD